MKLKKSLRIFLVLGLLLIILAPIVGGWFEKYRVVREEDKSIDVDSETSFLNVDSYDVSIKKGQKIIIKFSVYSENVIIISGTFKWLLASPRQSNGSPRSL